MTNKPAAQGKPPGKPAGMAPSKPPAPEQKGGFLLGMVVGLLLGLGIALGVALYVAKVPIPFVDKVPQRSSQADEQDAKAHKDWNPNANLPGSSKPRPAASGVVSAPGVGDNADANIGVPPQQAARPTTPTAAPPTAPPALAPGASKAATAAPTAKASDPKAAADAGFVFFVQAGAYTQAADAEQQRAKLAMQGFNAKVYERASGDKSVFRVRIGPFEQRPDAEALMVQVQGGGLEAVLVRTQR